MSAGSVVCDACSKTIHGELYHLGFSNMDALYCSQCPGVLLISDFSLIERQNIKCPDLQAHDPGFEPYERHLLPYYKKVEALFIPCSCGGVFAYMNPPLCPACHDKLKGDLYQDKPILKRTDLYAFVCEGSVKDVDQIKSEFLRLES